MAQLFANNATTKLAASINSSATTLTVTAGTGALFPTPTDGNYFLLTLAAVTAGTETSWEIIKVTARSTDTLTVIRAQESTAAASWAIDTKAEARLTAGSFGGLSTFPSQTGNNGKYLTTNGTTASWGILPSSLPVTTFSGSVTSVSVANGYFSVLQADGVTTTNVTVS